MIVLQFQNPDSTSFDEVFEQFKARFDPKFLFKSPSDPKLLVCRLQGTKAIRSLCVKGYYLHQRESSGAMSPVVGFESRHLSRAHYRGPYFDIIFNNESEFGRPNARSVRDMPCRWSSSTLDEHPHSRCAQWKHAPCLRTGGVFLGGGYKEKGGRVKRKGGYLEKRQKEVGEGG